MTIRSNRFLILRESLTAQTPMPNSSPTTLLTLPTLTTSGMKHGITYYPDRPFYSFVAAMEYCYAEMATPENLMVFGGGVLATICEAIADHEHFYLHFSSLFDDATCFSDETIQEGMEFIIKVYSNLRLKDLCRKYRSSRYNPLSKIAGAA
jgi:hypothetical protein